MLRSRMIRIMPAILLTAAAGICGGCSFFASAQEDVTIRTDPADATVIVNGIAYAGTPVTLPLSTKQPVLIEAYVPDHNGLPRTLRRNYVIRRTLSVWGMLDTVGTIWLVPSLGLATGGAYRFCETDVLIEMDPRQTNLTYVPEDQLGEL